MRQIHENLTRNFNGLDQFHVADEYEDDMTASTTMFGTAVVCTALQGQYFNAEP